MYVDGSRCSGSTPCAFDFCSVLCIGLGAIGSYGHVDVWILFFIRSFVDDPPLQLCLVGELIGW